MCVCVCVFKLMAIKPGYVTNFECFHFPGRELDNGDELRKVQQGRRRTEDRRTYSREDRRTYPEKTDEYGNQIGAYPTKQKTPNNTTSKPKTANKITKEAEAEDVPNEKRPTRTNSGYIGEWSKDLNSSTLLI